MPSCLQRTPKLLLLSSVARWLKPSKDTPNSMDGYNTLSLPNSEGSNSDFNRPEIFTKNEGFEEGK